MKKNTHCDHSHRAILSIHFEHNLIIFYNSDFKTFWIDSNDKFVSLSYESMLALVPLNLIG